MFYRLLTGGTLPVWYTFSGPVTFILEPGLLQNDEMKTVWEGIRRQEESDDAFAYRVAGILTGIYQRRGFQIYADISTSTHGFSTLGQVVLPGTYPRMPTDKLLGGRVMKTRPAGPPPSSMVSPSPNRLALTRSRDDLLATPSRPRRPRRSGSF